MKYRKIKKGNFIERPNRFIAYVNVEGEENNPQIVHVKNTGRCKELLVDNATVFLEESDNPNRKTKYDLVKVIKNGILINMDSQAPNKVVNEWLLNNGLFKNTELVKPEKTFEKSSVLFRRRDPAEPIYDFRLVLSGYDPGRQTGKPVLLAGAKRRRDFDCRTSKRRTP